MKDSELFPQTFLSTLGILDWGYTEEPKPMSWAHYKTWTEASLHSPLSYLADHRKDLREDLKKVYPKFQSALVFLFSYQEAKKWMLENNRHEVAAYSLGFEGEDYHHAVKRKLADIVSFLQVSHPELEHFMALDTQPILERDLAYRAGLGWFGKNSMLIHQKEGSYFIIGSLLLNQKLNLPNPAVDVDHCGQCVACVDACPTKAINPETRTLIADRCLSTFTIEVFKEANPPVGFEKSRGEIFGCDICQDVCPWNRKPLQRVAAILQLNEKFAFLKEWFYQIPKSHMRDLIQLETKRGLKRKLQGTPFDRPGREGWLKNLRAFFSRSNQNGL